MAEPGGLDRISVETKTDHLLPSKHSAKAETKLDYSPAVLEMQPNSRQTLTSAFES